MISSIKFNKKLGFDNNELIDVKFLKKGLIKLKNKYEILN